MATIKFLTYGVLIREMMEDPLLTKYRYIDKNDFQIVHVY
jgi:HrpA-like RNA helicase